MHLRISSNYIIYTIPFSKSLDTIYIFDKIFLIFLILNLISSLNPSPDTQILSNHHGTSSKVISILRRRITPQINDANSASSARKNISAISIQSARDTQCKREYTYTRYRLLQVNLFIKLYTRAGEPKNLSRTTDERCRMRERRFYDSVTPSFPSSPLVSRPKLIYYMPWDEQEGTRRNDRFLIRDQNDTI